MVTEIDYQGTFRWMDRGEWDKTTIEIANRLVELRPDVKFSTFSRDLEALKILDRRIIRLYSMDKTTVHRVSEIPKDIRIAYLKSEENEEIPERVSVVFPIDHKPELLGHKKDCSFFKTPLAKCYNCLRCYE